MVVGNPQKSLEFVLAGPAIDEAAQAEKNASAGQIILSPAIMATFYQQETPHFTPLTESVPPLPPTPLLQNDTFQAGRLKAVRDLV